MTAAEVSRVWSIGDSRMNPRAAWFAGSKLPCRVNVVTIYPFGLLFYHMSMGTFSLIMDGGVLQT